MRDPVCIQRAIEYIEENLRNDISVEDVANAVGYSHYHFIGVFREALHMTPADYIRKRRISEIVRQMAYDSRPMSEIAFSYGFNSKENFTRAFKKEHQILPSEFKLTQNSLKLYDRILFPSEGTDHAGRETDGAAEAEDEGEFCLQGVLQEMESFRLVVYKNEEETTPKFWNRYNVDKLSKRLSGGRTVEDFGACIWNASAGKLDYFIGIREEEAQGELAGTEVLEIPGGLYAVFETPKTTHFHFVSVIHKTWDYIGRVWLPQNGYRRTGGYELESYVEESRTFSEKIYIPVVRL